MKLHSQSKVGVQMHPELKQAFPYTAPDSRTRVKYARIFLLVSIDERFSKLVFDKTIALLALAAVSPILCAVVGVHLVISVFFPEQRGSLLINYKAISKGRIFRKYKFRVIKQAFIDKEAALRGDWNAHAAEWIPESRTYLGVVLKKFYLDELPQLFSILLGYMSLVGPRPLATHHYERDLAQGNVYRKLVRAGLFGPSQALKGTRSFGSPKSEYEYLDKYINSSPLGLLRYDLTVIARCLRVVFQAKGL
jgi:lipopolysaccharide/colanic/teichoic acid biosynthesis glycosyltransferase